MLARPIVSMLLTYVVLVGSCLGTGTAFADDGEDRLAPLPPPNSIYPPPGSACPWNFESFGKDAARFKELFGDVRASADFQESIKWQASGVEEDGPKVLIKVMMFSKDLDSTSERFVVSEGGAVFAWWVTQLNMAATINDRRLTPAQIGAMNVSLSKLPPSAKTPPRSRMVCVSFWHPSDGQKWETRMYDRDHIPESLEAVFQTTGYYKEASFWKRRLKAGSVPRPASRDHRPRPQ